ncbi:MAG: phosphoribosylamine--glycine ligase [Oscillospiraceae bacterium]
MNVLVVGSGAREHAIIKKLAQSPRVKKLYAAPGNGGIADQAECISELKATDIDGIVNFTKNNQIDFVVVAPDDPLVLGMVDTLNANGIKTFGPNKAAAAIEGSKVFSKELMKKYNIPTAEYVAFSDAQEAVEYVKKQNTFPTVIKADGLALGKGVIIAENFDEAVKGIESIMNDKIFGESGNNIVIEEFLRGPEISVLSFCDSKTIVPMVSAMDHKRAFDGDNGPNTGGMGAIVPNPFYTPEVSQICMEKIFIPTMEAMNKEGRPFKGCIFFGLMVTAKGPKVIEYNCRFGDPETQVVLPLLKNDLLDVFEAVYDERLSEIDVEFERKAAACVVMASGGYPKQYSTGYKISGLDEHGQAKNVQVYHAGTKLMDDGEYVTSGGRVLGVTSVASTLKDALQISYSTLKTIHFENAQYRKDIGGKVF